MGVMWERWIGIGFRREADEEGEGRLSDSGSRLCA